MVIKTGHENTNTDDLGSVIWKGIKITWTSTTKE